MPRCIRRDQPARPGLRIRLVEFNRFGRIRGVIRPLRGLTVEEEGLGRAAACREAGGRLVLVVDGLDEDSGVTTVPGAHRIAALLPDCPSDGMRVVIAGWACGIAT